MGLPALRSDEIAGHDSRFKAGPASPTRRSVAWRVPADAGIDPFPFAQATKRDQHWQDPQGIPPGEPRRLQAAVCPYGPDDGQEEKAVWREHELPVRCRWKPPRSEIHDGHSGNAAQGDSGTSLPASSLEKKDAGQNEYPDESANPTGGPAYFFPSSLFHGIASPHSVCIGRIRCDTAQVQALHTGLFHFRKDLLLRRLTAREWARISRRLKSIRVAVESRHVLDADRPPGQKKSGRLC